MKLKIMIFALLLVSSFGTAFAIEHPDPPTNLIAYASARQVELHWTAPLDDGGSPIIDYLIQYKLSTDRGWDYVDTRSTSLVYTITGLTNGLSYDFRVITQTTQSYSFSSTSISITLPLPTTPDPPTKPIAIPGDRQVHLSWTAPLNTGGFPINNYYIEYKIASDTDWDYINTLDNLLEYTITGLINGELYGFRVSADNVQSFGLSSTIVTAVPSKTTSTAPSTPTNLTAISDDGKVHLSWVAPLDEGSSAIINYFITYKLSIDTDWDYIETRDSILEYTITGLTNGLSYDFQVTAANAQLFGTPSSIVTAIPSETPDESKKKSNGGCSDCIYPTIGFDTKGTLLVTDGICINNSCMDAGAYHTEYPMVNTTIYSPNTISVKYYENGSPSNIKLIQLGIGVNEVGLPLSESQALIEVHLNYFKNDMYNPTIKEIILIDPDEIIHMYDADVFLVSCMDDSNYSDCLQTDFSYSYSKAPTSPILVSNAVDYNKNTRNFYFNDGLNVSSPPIIIPPKIEKEPRECKISSVPNRNNPCQFLPMIEYEQYRAQQLLLNNSTTILQRLK